MGLLSLSGGWAGGGGLERTEKEALAEPVKDERKRQWCKVRGRGGQGEREDRAGQPPPKFQRQVPESRNQETLVLTLPGPANFNSSNPNAVVLNHLLPHSLSSPRISLSTKETTGFSSLKSVNLLDSSLSLTGFESITKFQ